MIKIDLDDDRVRALIFALEHFLKCELDIVWVLSDLKRIKEVKWHIYIDNQKE